MNDLFIALRNQIIHLLYTQFLKRIFFLVEPEKIHDGITKVGEILGNNSLTRSLTSLLFNYSSPALEQNILGINFKNPLGLAAGFDKDARLTDILPSVGFGFAEVGSITGQPCEGNPKPRLWRLKKSKGLVVYYGLKNEGCEIISSRLRKKNFLIPVGTSIAKTNCPETVETKAGIADYLKAYQSFTTIGSYFTINISCPNAYGGLPFTEPKKLDLLLDEIDKVKTSKPVFLKLPPCISEEEVDELLKVVGKHQVDGFICTNLTKDRMNQRLKIREKEIPGEGKGGLSGKVVEDLANELITHLYQKIQGKYIIIGCGGVFSAEDAYKKIKLGASLIQLITGMIFEGPQVIGEINRGLVKLLKADGYTHISQAIGKEIS
ncbi:MAG: Dihydroorotate dehydrogenase 2 [Candidatus Daviesbacteria bacterium GW2011_GWA1_41_61]|uniref:Dihydroorotate dehydrogenase (quinone) n=1 Tax=Candidatus Daviesbacteria bacterium GW2011_GWA2_40_9 TaxID=1618424 RepID=A0A0G0U0U5_9BACT|nr:MAG: Dihydroorotate dehydrogenase 2 [Candidatus Daviesbacteria bacterium GW2011_GWC1_40_9]KKR82688.1 MAG: Dihydroorotate dehydrogenase 2 [Candidatus Daviesbacteria bacterium GW2011_GWA2_40_9]KKR93356.1 MAG: Dihydroorotate dehydrogenase 2 [Candidatus Daviesbacteria bacterium GW2011_GWB1_41_15]KKS15095.1 MAG: Dihydroorotate dehydrogenase 2 [Candidatus Daviesbacteria bacterium GW2011_GWA1_41_61]